TYRILLSAYACFPTHGSEPEIGWKWADELARVGHKVTVLTRRMDAQWLRREELPDDVEFCFVDASPSVQRIVSALVSARGYYYLWQIMAFLKARRLHQRRHFDVVQHVTYGMLRIPGFM